MYLKETKFESGCSGRMCNTDREFVSWTRALSWKGEALYLWIYPVAVPACVKLNPLALDALKRVNHVLQQLRLWDLVWCWQWETLHVNCSNWSQSLRVFSTLGTDGDGLGVGMQQSHLVHSRLSSLISQTSALWLFAFSGKKHLNTDGTMQFKKELETPNPSNQMTPPSSFFFSKGYCYKC